MNGAESERATQKNVAARAWLRALQATASIATQPARTLPTVFDELADACTEMPALLSEGECLSFGELVGRANRYARWAIAQRIVKGDVVCLMMPNCPDYLAIWLGITHIGGTVALLNTNLRGSALAHCIEIVDPSHIIVAGELLGTLERAQTQLPRLAGTWLYGADGLQPRIEREIQQYSPARLADWERRSVGIEDRALLIYTSGTTGLPKAVVISHHRLMVWSFWFAGMLDTGPSDRMYNCLPMYHAVGGIVAIGSVLARGGSVVIREKFSAGHFWEDVASTQCTLFQYIGDLCRYLVNSERHPREREHRLRLCCGNGLRGDVWNEFKDRFGIPQILEFYAGTEANFSLYNVDGEPGAVGRIPPFLRHRVPVALIKLNADTDEPLRACDGLCVQAAVGEAGEAISLIQDGFAGIGDRFEGHGGKLDSDKNILRDVFAVGDSWFRSGDLMRCDERGFFYFVDRICDNFRWNGENVATVEVADALTAYPGILAASVYGVVVAGRDGRASMGAITTNDRFELTGLPAHLAQRLPPYARPIFLRIQDELEVTPTFKPKKRELVQSGFDPAQIGDPLYFFSPESGAFVSLDRVLYEQIVSGRLRF